MKIQILNVNVVTRSERATSVQVEGRVDGHKFTAYTDITGDEGVPDVDATLPAVVAMIDPAEFAVALHNALEAQAADVVAEEMRRIGG